MCFICSRSGAHINALDMSTASAWYLPGWWRSIIPLLLLLSGPNLILLAVISSRQQGACSSRTPRLLLFMLRVFRILFYSVLLFIPEGGDWWDAHHPPPLSTSLACINRRIQVCLASHSDPHPVCPSWSPSLESTPFCWPRRLFYRAQACERFPELKWGLCGALLTLNGAHSQCSWYLPKASFLLLIRLVWCDGGVVSYNPFLLLSK